MDLTTLFLESDNWQKDTFMRIKKSLISTGNSRFIRYENSKENHLVMIYGNSQVGKTTLILSMIGIKNEFFREVHDTLRAGILRGNSSTSTAIIYAKSNNQQYGFSLVKLNHVSDKEIEYFDRGGMVNRLKKMRHEVETNRAKADDILYIYIPCHYFTDDAEKYNISIIDMPGVESRNYKESSHVENLMTRYIPAASVCIIVCRSNNIQSLENITLPNGIDWKRMSHRFIVVLTYAYSAGTVKKYFDEKISARKIGFYDYVRRLYDEEKKGVLGQDNKMEIFPVDVGDSLDRLCEKEIKDRKDCEEIRATQNRILEELRKAISERKGERLKSAIDDMRTIVEHYGEDEKENISFEIQEIENRKKRKENQIKQIREEIKKLAEDKLSQNEITRKQEIKAKLITTLSDINKKWQFDAEKFVVSQGLYKGKGDAQYLKDKEKKLLEGMRDYADQYVESFLKKIKSFVEGEKINIAIHKQAVDTIVLSYENIIYPEKKGLFQKREKIFLYQVNCYCSEIQKKVSSYLNGVVNQYIKILDASILEQQQEIYRTDDLQKRRENNIKKLEKDISKCNAEIIEWRNEEKRIEQKKKQDKATLNMWMKYAKEAYCAQRADIIQKINSKCSAEDKMLYILFLGILEKDYVRVTGGGSENENRNERDQ